jgi:1-acyl-sn-glycerol-3-phosphate acyltransferase
MSAASPKRNMDSSRLHDRARTRGVNPLVYRVSRALLHLVALVYWRLRRIGLEHVPAEGPVLFVCNHRSIIDPFIIGLCSPRPIYYVAKSEIFGSRLVGWYVSALGAFPVRRGKADADMIETAKLILGRGDPVLMFPEGTRTRPGPLGTPKRGVGRLALETGATVIPVAMIGTEAIREGWRIRPKQIRVRIGAPLEFPHVEPATAQLAAEVTERIWADVMALWEELGGLPRLRRAAVIGAGPWGTAIAVALARAGVDVDLVPATGAEASGAELPARVTLPSASALDLSRHDLVTFAVPAAQLAAVVAEHGRHIAERTGVLVAPAGLVPPSGTRPSAYVAKRTAARAVGVLGGPADPAEFLDGGAAIVVASSDAGFARQVELALRAAKLRVKRSTDVAGVERGSGAPAAAAPGPQPAAL